jgi:hypothetical protein
VSAAGKAVMMATQATMRRIKKSLKNSNKENVNDGECFKLQMTFAETVYSPNGITKCRC